MTWRKSAVRVRYRPPLQNIVEHIVCSTFLFIAVMDDNGQHTLLQSNRGAQVALATWRKKNALHFLYVFKLALVTRKRFVKCFLRTRHSFAVRYRPPTLPRQAHFMAPKFKILIYLINYDIILSINNYILTKGELL